MKPITDDIVLTLIKGAEKRQSKISASTGDRQMSARIIDFATQNGKVASDPGDRVVSLDFVRRAGKVRRTISGVFHFVPRT